MINIKNLDPSKIKISHTKKSYKNKSFKNISITTFSMELRCGSFFEKHIENKHLYSPDKDNYYFCKSSIPVNK